MRIKYFVLGFILVLVFISVPILFGKQDDNNVNINLVKDNINICPGPLCQYG